MLAAKSGTGGGGAADPPGASLSSFPPALGAGEVHLWRVPLDEPKVSPEALGALLPPAELERASRLVREVYRRRFILARAALRLLLGGYLGTAAREVALGLTAKGKPFLEGTSAGGGRELRFNVSHSQELALVALARGREVGVDIERKRPRAPGIARRFFSPRENAVLEGLSEPERSEAFFRAWVRKEAYVKARGLGLLLPLGSFDVSLAPGEAARLLGTRPDPQDAARWQLAEPVVPESYAAALAVEGREGFELRQWDFDFARFVPLSGGEGAGSGR